MPNTSTDDTRTSPLTASLMPCMRYRDARAAADWLERAFGFARHAFHADDAGGVAHAELRFGNGLVMFGSDRGPDPANPWTTQDGVYVVVDDVDSHHRRAVAAGAEVVRPPADTPYGSREYSVRDLEGRLWSFGTYRP